MRIGHSRLLLALGVSVLAACSKPAGKDELPLAYVPADTPYVYANIEPTPAPIIEQWSKRMQAYLPTLLSLYDHALDRAGATGDADSQRALKIAHALLDELETHADWDKLRQIGFKPDAHVAFYGVGMVPVLRLELADPAMFRAEVARVEEKVGEKMPVAKTGAQEYWQLGNDPIAAVIAIEGSHLVLTALPPQADDTLKQTLLGVTPPAQSLLAAGTLQALAKQYGYTPYGAGFIDIVRLTERLTSAAAGSDAAFAKALGMPMTGSDETCRADYLEIARKFPRLVAGAEELGTQRVRISAQLEIESGLAQQLATALGSAPGTGAAGEGIADISVALPILRLKDFWLKQADAVTAKPFACPSLAALNDGYRSSRQNIDVTVPPPASDLTGVRFTLDKFDFAQAQVIPDIAGRVLMASNNPTAALAMAQLAMPGLAKLKIPADGKPVPVPAGIAPPGTPPLAVAMSDKAIAIAAGTGEDALLGAYLAAPAASDAVFLRMHFSGAFYGVLAKAFDMLKAKMPADQQAQFDQQRQMFAMYEKWLRTIDISLTAVANGIALRETIEQNP
jgi:hypothetical protein